jgi:uncharacterized protein YegL
MIQISGLSKSARPMPLLILADRSGSMSGSKIMALNQGLQDAMQDLKADPQTADNVLLCVITFGGNVSEDVLFEPISSATIPTLSAGGDTPVGQCLRLVTARLADKSLVPERAIRPVIALLSDGQPTDDYLPVLNEFIHHRRAGQAIRISFAIGDDADRGMLAKFASAEYPVLEANEANKIKSFFQFVTWVSKSHSQGRILPDSAPPDLLP